MSQINDIESNAPADATAVLREGSGSNVKPATHTPCLIYDDPREITDLYYPGATDGLAWRVGNAGVTAIAAYREHGQGDYVPWLAIYKGDEIAARIPAAFVEINYRAAVAKATLP